MLSFRETASLLHVIKLLFSSYRVQLLPKWQNNQSYLCTDKLFVKRKNPFSLIRDKSLPQEKVLLWNPARLCRIFCGYTKTILLCRGHARETDDSTMLLFPRMCGPLWVGIFFTVIFAFPCGCYMKLLVRGHVQGVFLLTQEWLRNFAERTELTDRSKLNDSRERQIAVELGSYSHQHC